MKIRIEDPIVTGSAELSTWRGIVRTKLKELGRENAKLAMKIHKQRAALKRQRHDLEIYRERHERDAAIWTALMKYPEVHAEMMDMKREQIRKTLGLK